MSSNEGGFDMSKLRDIGKAYIEIKPKRRFRGILGRKIKKKMAQRREKKERISKIFMEETRKAEREFIRRSARQKLKQKFAPKRRPRIATRAKADELMKGLEALTGGKPVKKTQAKKKRPRVIRIELI
jgi:hypothetical protein